MQRRLPILLIALLHLLTAFAEQTSIYFEVSKHNFGVIAEDGGVVEHTFVGRNSTDAPIVILDVSAFKLMLSNNKKKKAEKADDTDPETISTGKKVRLVILEILKCIGVVLFGAFVVLYRIINNLWRLHKIKHGYGLVMPFTETAGFDALISVAVFLMFFLITYICILIAK